MDAAQAEATRATANPFDDFFNSPEMRAQRAERANRNAMKREAVLKEYGSILNVFEPTVREAALRKAAEPFAILMPYACISGVDRHYTAFIDGEAAGDLFKCTERARAAVASAYPMPVTIAEALAEIKSWDRLRWDRSLFFDLYGYNSEPEVDLRVQLIEELLEAQPANSWQDVKDRFAWKRYAFERQWIEPQHLNDPFIDRIEADFRILREMAWQQATVQSGQQSEPVQSGRMTNAKKAEAVKSLLKSNPALSDREIARQAGVSPQTVNNWRARLGLRKEAA